MSQGDAIRWLRGLMTLPAAEQSGALSRRLKSYATEDATERAHLVRMLFEAASELPPAERKEYAKARASAVSRFPMSTQMALLGTYREVLSNLSEDRAEQEKATLESILPELTGADRAATERFLNYLPRRVDASSDKAEDKRRSRRRLWKFPL